MWDAHEFLPGLTPWVDNARWLPGNCAHEREFAPYADAVVTISDSLAKLLQEHHTLAELPAVVLNAPDGSQSDEELDAPVDDVRAMCGVGEHRTLLVYCGVINPVRGVEIMIESLPRLADAHVALVSVPPGRTANRHVQSLISRAQELDVADRVHLLPYVPHWQVPAFLSTADAAVSPLLHLPNHEIALSNKFFEYSHAKLPLIVSDVRTMAQAVRATGQGEVFRAGDLDDYVRAVRAVLDDPQRFRAAYDEPGLLADWTWKRQAAVLDAVYARLLSDQSVRLGIPPPRSGAGTGRSGGAIQAVTT